MKRPWSTIIGYEKTMVYKYQAWKDPVWPLLDMKNPCRPISGIKKPLSTNSLIENAIFDQYLVPRSTIYWEWIGHGWQVLCIKDHGWPILGFKKQWSTDIGCEKTVVEPTRIGYEKTIIDHYWIWRNHGQPKTGMKKKHGWPSTDTGHEKTRLPPNFGKICF